MKSVLSILLLLPLVSWAAEPALKSTVLENDILWVRVNRAEGDLSAQLRVAQPTNTLIGLVLDFRYADGTNALSGNDLQSGHLPVVLLVNQQTTGAALDLAEQLRHSKAGIVIGTSNSPAQLPPDVTVTVPAAGEQKLFENPFTPWPSTNAVPAGTNNNMLALVDHISEAELVRQRVKDGEADDETAAATPRSAPARTVIQDPVLARAVDFLRALAALHPRRG
jgi:hypothetical protein